MATFTWKKQLLFSFLLWLIILFIGKNSVISYWHNVVNREPIIRSYIDACVSDFPFSFCRLVYNKLMFAVPERILSFLDPLSVENVLLKTKSIIPLLFFPFYVLGLFALLWKFKKYFFFSLVIFTTLLISLLWQVRTPFYLLSLPIIFIIGIKEFLGLRKQNYA